MFNITLEYAVLRASYSVKTILFSTLLIGGVSLAGCSNSTYVTGNSPERAKITQVKVGQSTKADVAELVGTPSNTSAFSDNVWYYTSQTRRKRAFFRDKVDKQTVVALGFDSQDVLQGTKVYTLQDGRLINPNNQKTETAGRKLSIFEQLIGNVGRFSGK
ncbi:MAG: outer membrane protein assembly factor BamE [Alphaproteobacteria bacterium]